MHLAAEDTAHAPLAQRARRFLAAHRWLSVVAVTILLQFGLVMSFNLVVDPRAEFGTGAFEPLVVESRQLKVLAYAGLDPKPDTIVVGSSRAMTISPTVLEASGYGPSYNFAVDSGKITDALRVHEEAVAAGAPPRHMVLLTEDWAFRSDVQVPWPSADGIAAGDLPALAGRLVASARADYVQDSWRSVRLHAEGFPLRDMAFQPDGTVVWEKADHETAAGVYDEQAAMDKLFAYTKGMYDRAPLGPEPAYVDALDRLLAAARASGTSITFVMPPMTDAAASRLDAEAYAASLDATRALLLSRCAPGVRVLDLSDPASVGATSADFIDGFHPTRAGGERITRAIVEQPGLCQQGL